MKNKKLWITAVLLSGMLALPVQAAVISPGSENVRRSTVTKMAVSPKTGEGTGESVALLLACVSASAAVFSFRLLFPFPVCKNGCRCRYTGKQKSHGLSRTFSCFR